MSRRYCRVPPPWKLLTAAGGPTVPLAVRDELLREVAAESLKDEGREREEASRCGRDWLWERPLLPGGGEEGEGGGDESHLLLDNSSTS